MNSAGAAEIAGVVELVVVVLATSIRAGGMAKRRMGLAELLR